MRGVFFFCYVPTTGIRDEFLIIRGESWYIQGVVGASKHSTLLYDANM